jgi:hypothetical protein
MPFSKGKENDISTTSSISLKHLEPSKPSIQVTIDPKDQDTSSNVRLTSRKIKCENNPDGIPLFWSWQHKECCPSFVLAPVIGAAIAGYIYWIVTKAPPKTPEDRAFIVGISFFWFLLGLVLLCLGIAALTHALVFLLCVLTFPFLILHTFYVLFLAPFVVLVLGRFTGDIPESLDCSICSHCRAIITRCPLIVGRTSCGLIGSKKEYKLRGIHNLRISAKDCHLCSTLLHSIDEYQQNKYIPLKLKIWSISFCTRRPVIRMQIVGDSVKSTVLKLEKLEKLQTPIDSVSHNCSRSVRTDSKDVLEWAKIQIQLCEESHEPCRSRFANKKVKYYAPTRLLDLGQDYPIIQLIETGNLPHEHCTYIALSHHRDHEQLKPTINIDYINMDKIGSDLPASVRDAAVTARELGIRYLWVESLCVAQNDKEREKEVDLGLAVANAKCVISASTSDGGKNGCFTKRDLFRHDCIVFNSNDLQLVVRSEVDPDITALFQEKVDTSPLVKRKAAFQDRYLASRVLHFCDGDVLFECNESTSCSHANGSSQKEHSPRQVIRYDGTLHNESDTNYVLEDLPKTIETTHVETITDSDGVVSTRNVTKVSPNPAYVLQEKKIKNMAEASAKLGLRGSFSLLYRFRGVSKQERIEHSHAWFEMIEQYVRCSIEEHEDQLKAISGLAYAIQENTDMTYNSGLWQETLAFGLLWTRSSELKIRPTRSIPTWSWASVDGNISHRLLEATPPERNEFRSSWTDITQHINDNCINVIVKEKTIDLIMNSVLRIKCRIWDSPSENKPNIIWDVKLGASIPNNELFLLPIVSFKNPKVHPMGSGIQLHGIVLRKTSATVYERAGYFWTAEHNVVEEPLSQTSSSKPQEEVHEVMKLGVTESITETLLFQYGGKSREETIILI